MKIIKILILNLLMIVVGTIFGFLVLGAFGDPLGLAVCVVLAIVGAIIIPSLTKKKNQLNEENIDQ